MRSRSSRTVGIFFGLFYLQVLAAAALGIYPLQGGRTSMFIYPVTLFLACAGLVVLTSFRRVTALSALATCLLAAAALYWLGGLLYRREQQILRVVTARPE